MELSPVQQTRFTHKINVQGNVETDQDITLSAEMGGLITSINVKEGPKFDVNDIYFNGELLFTESELREKIKLNSGDVYSEETLRQDIQALTEMYQDKGYAFANVLRRLQIVPGENKVDIHYSFERINAFPEKLFFDQEWI